jgi:iron(III) transport system ATP-binding protein
VAVRAEQVQVLAASGSPEPDDASGVPAAVVEVSFFGHDATVRVRLRDGSDVVARTPADGVPHPGDPVCVRVLGDVVAFPETGAT